MHALLSRLMNMFPTEPGELASLPGPTQLSVACRRGLTLLQVMGDWAEPGKEEKSEVGGGEGGGGGRDQEGKRCSINRRDVLSTR